MKAFILLLLVGVLSVLCYDRGAVVNYAAVHWNNPNHSCDGVTSCSPYSYWGDEACGYEGEGGDCANFVSQCLLAGGHEALNRGGCRGYPCGVEEVGAERLGACLENGYGWKSSCGYLMGPPGDVRAGDVLIYHASSCDDWDAHATVVVSAWEGGAEIACHSNAHYGIDYTYMSGYMPYFEWIRYPY